MLGIAAVPAEFVPMRFPWIGPLPPAKSTPEKWLPEITFPLAGSAAAHESGSRETYECPVHDCGSQRVPAALVPMKLPWIVAPVAVESKKMPTPLPEIRLQSPVQAPPGVVPVELPTLGWRRSLIHHRPRLNLLRCLTCVGPNVVAAQRHRVGFDANFVAVEVVKDEMGDCRARRAAGDLDSVADNSAAVDLDFGVPPSIDICW